MACDHRYKVELDGGTGTIKCQRCGDVRFDGLPLDADQEAIQERIVWEQRAKKIGLWLPT